MKHITSKSLITAAAFVVAGSVHAGCTVTQTITNNKEMSQTSLLQSGGVQAIGAIETGGTDCSTCSIS